MSKRTTFTTISPLPAGITREAVIAFLHDHQEMIDLNPLIIERHPISPPPHAPDEETRCVWWSLTDRISYLPGGLVSGQIEYTAAFNDLPDGIQTHCYAPLSTDIRERWTLGGTLPGEPLEPVEIGLGAPRQGLYLREDVELRCNFMMAGFVKKTLKNAHGTLVERLCQKAALASSKNPSPGTSPNGSMSSRAANGAGGGIRAAADAAYQTDGSINRFSGEQAHPRYSYPEPTPQANISRPPQYIPYRKPVPPPANGLANGWAGVHQDGPAELQ
ncbi:putative NACHT and WD40 domain [Rosellinia necatrix]|uniref:Putative NACHT and WD40 domain n=1 Tax=Rosellinia necatrix TaxID=77044 RepID=A0A1S7UHQ3_ROSNE|nr:putative NACHT and WD40 domain [Rosellinia necatrix]